MVKNALSFIIFEFMFFFIVFAITYASTFAYTFEKIGLFDLAALVYLFTVIVRLCNAISYTD